MNAYIAKMGKPVKRKLKLTARELVAMMAVEDGADVFDWGIATDLRAVQKKAPHMLLIGKAQGRYKPTSQLPYFGCILTPAGIDALPTPRHKAA